MNCDERLQTEKGDYSLFGITRIYTTCDVAIGVYGTAICSMEFQSIKLLSSFNFFLRVKQQC